ncbi:hypothetical protein ccbrp13_29460 [Ktedonobacteria bacterium brp13]|nr:hypothetical protein ccbrp13_29460 [Ktedonobacteria bacterium brp13]
MHENAAALLASRGYAAFALAYFKREGQPKQLKNIPLEYFEHAIAWLQEQPEVAADKIAVIGLSRGGELALLLGATISSVRAIIAGAPSGIRHSAVSAGTKAAWTYHGEPLPFLTFKPGFFDSIGMTINAFKSMFTHTPMTMKAGFIKLLKKEEEVAAATIPVEQTQGPILLLAGQQDQLWPSALYSEKVMERLRAHNFAYTYTHLNYAEAGHFVCFPYGLPSLPPMVSVTYPNGFGMTFGGSPRANADAASDSWQKILAFLQQNLSD